MALIPLLWSSLGTQSEFNSQLHPKAYRVNRPAELSEEEAVEGIAFVEEIRCNAREDPGPRRKLSSNCSRSATK